MLEVDTGKYGAKRQSLRLANPRDILHKIITATPGGTEDELMEDCWHKIHRNTSLMRTVFEYWFANNFRSLVMQGAAETPVTKRRTTKTVEQFKKTIRQQITVKLLNMVMPTGKTLAESSREELLTLGGWVHKIAERLQPGQTVAAAGLTETALRKLYLELRTDE